jgi:hypothetical protein
MTIGDVTNPTHGRTMREDNIQLVLVGLGSLVAAELFATLRVRHA